MKILIISKAGDGFGIAQKLKAEGHDVRIWVEEKGFDTVGAGIVNQVSNWQPSASEWADLVISDMVGFGKLAKRLEGFKVPHLGFNQIGDMMELDRGKQMQMFRRFSVPIPETQEFSNPEQAKSILDDWRNPGYVIKPNGNLDTGKTMMARDPDIYEWSLDQFSGDQGLIVQEIEEGVEISTEGWFDGQEWLTPFNHTIEYKRFFPGKVGTNTGSMGNVVWPVTNPRKDRFVDNLKRLTPFLRAAKYKGPLDINTIANPSGIWALEVTSRLGYDAIEALYETLSPKNLTEILFTLAKSPPGKAHEKINIPMRKGFGVAVRLTVPPYPFNKADKDLAGMPVVGIPRDLNHVYATDLFFNRGQFKWSASDGVLAKVAGFGKTIDQARKNAYSVADKVDTQGLQFRVDIGESAEADINKLKAWGYM